MFPVFFKNTTPSEIYIINKIKFWDKFVVQLKFFEFLSLPKLKSISLLYPLYYPKKLFWLEASCLKYSWKPLQY